MREEESRLKRIVLINLALFLVLFAIAIGVADYLYQRSHFIATDNAHVTAHLVDIYAPETAVLSVWTARTGDQIHTGNVLGDIRTSARTPDVGSTTRTGKRSQVTTKVVQQAITAPISGTILMAAATSGQVVSQGQQLAVIGDLSREYIVAYVDDKAIRNIDVGQNVDVYLDSYPGTTFSGQVAQIGGVAGDMLSPVGLAATTASATQLAKRIAVRITVQSFLGKYVVPGMNASIRIHR